MAIHKTGGDIDAYCNKCKLVLAHVIIAMNGTRIVRVECKTCRGVHAYKKEAGASSSGSVGGTKRAASSRGGARASNNIGPSEYDKVLKGRDVSRAQRYKASVSYAEGDVVDHIKFGLGFITRLLADGKVEVLFPEGVKVLVHDRGAQA